MLLNSGIIAHYCAAKFEQTNTFCYQRLTTLATKSQLKVQYKNG